MGTVDRGEEPHGQEGPLTGLTVQEAVRRLRQYGPNAVAAPSPTPVWRRAAQQLKDPLIVVLLVAGVLTAATGDLVDTGIIFFVVAANSTVGVAQEVRAERAVAALRDLTAPEVRAVRDGAERLIAAADVVPGDLVLLGEGDIVPADGALTSASSLLVDESALTGESVPVAKSAADDEATRLSAGTVVVNGHGALAVDATGPRSALGRIASLMAERPAPTPLQRRLAQLGKTLAAAAVLLSAGVVISGLLVGRPVVLVVVTAISLVVAAVPESLPAVVTLALALGARRMAARHAIARRLPAVETLGAVTVLATDKTGTLTEGTMAAERLWTPRGQAELSGTGYAPEGVTLRGDVAVGPDSAPDLAVLLEAAVLCNDAALERRDDGSWAGLGNPMEAALLAGAARFGIDRTETVRSMPRIDEVPFSSTSKRMLTAHRMPEDGTYVVAKGAPEVVLEDVDPADAEVAAQAAETSRRWAEDGYRVLAVAAAGAPTSGPHTPSLWNRPLHLLGLIGIADPPRTAAAETISSCRRAGIVPVLITGDHLLTATAVARRLGIVTPDASPDNDPTGQNTVTRPGAASPESSDHRRTSPYRLSSDGLLYARTTPEQKLDIITSLRDEGHVVAMTGDGVNDGPALVRADIGVAMGRRGTEVARQAADLVLADDDLGTVVAAVEEGRRVYANVRRFLLYGLSGGTAEILVMLLGPLLGFPLPLLPAQILWINLLTHGLPGVALGAEPAAAGTMSRPPRPPEQSVLGGGLWPRILVMGCVIAAASLAAGLWARITGQHWQSMLFLTLGAVQLGVALGVRAQPRTLANPFLLAAVAGAAALQFAGVLLPPLHSLLRTETLHWSGIVLACALLVLGYAVMRALSSTGRWR